MSSRRGRSRRRKPSRPSNKQLKAFWGDEERLPDLPHTARIVSDASATVRSLGKVPLPGHETIADHYFEAVLERAVTLGTALAAAGGLVAADDLTEH